MLWALVCVVSLVAGCVKDNSVLVAVSGLYAIAAAIDVGAEAIKQAIGGKNGMNRLNSDKT